MSITTEYANLAAQQSSKNAAMTTFDVDPFGPAKVTTEKNGLVVISTYTYKGDDAAKPTTMIVRRETTKDGGSRNSLRLITRVTITDDVALSVKEEDHEVSIAWNHPGTYLTYPAGLSRLLQSAVSIVIGVYDNTTGVPQRSVLEAMNYGITNDI